MPASSSSSSTSCPPRPPPRLRLFHLHFRLAPPPLPPCQPCQLVAKLFANCPAQCALLDLNLRAAQLSVHCWTSTCELPSSAQRAQIECQKICQIECQIECQKICQIKCHEICQIECQKICQIECQIDMPDRYAR